VPGIVFTNKDVLRREFPFLNRFIPEGSPAEVHAKKIRLELLQEYARQETHEYFTGMPYDESWEYYILTEGGAILASSQEGVVTVVKRFFWVKYKSRKRVVGRTLGSLLDTLSEEERANAKFILERKKSTKGPALIVTLHRPPHKLGLLDRVEQLVEERRRELLDDEGVEERRRELQDEEEPAEP
jgi:hypothetical protein